MEIRTWYKLLKCYSHISNCLEDCPTRQSPIPQPWPCRSPKEATSYSADRPGECWTATRWWGWLFWSRKCRSGCRSRALMWGVGSTMGGSMPMQSWDGGSWDLSADCSPRAHSELPKTKFSPFPMCNELPSWSNFDELRIRRRTCGLKCISRF